MIETKIKLKDIKPSGLNPREETFGDLKAMAESFSVNSLRPGEPINPILVVKDGNIYRIIDGERRFKAMVLAKTKECAVILADDLDEGNTISEMMATDDKQKLNSREKSKGVQQMLRLGVDTVTVAKIANLDPKITASAKKALTIVKPKKPETMSIDELAAQYDFPQIINSLANIITKEGGLERDDKADGYPKYETVEWRIDNAKDYKAALAKLPQNKDEYVVAIKNTDPFFAHNKPVIRIFKKLQLTKSGKPVKSKREVLKGHLDKQNKAARKLRAQFVAEHIATWDKDLKHLGSFCVKHLGYHIINAKRFDEKYGCKTPITINAVLISMIWGYMEWDKLQLGSACGVNVSTSTSGYTGSTEDYQRHIDMMQALAKDGYQISLEEQELINLLTAYIDKQKAKEGSADNGGD